MNFKTKPNLLKRILSTIIDYSVYYAFFAWLVTTYGVPNNEGGYTLSNDPKSIWIIIVWCVYFPVIESIQGQTLGKLLLGLRVVTKNGRRISLGQAFLRHLVDIPEFFFFGLVAIITIKNTPNHQRLGDLWANTIVIDKDDFTCSHCGENLALSAKELDSGEFICPSCNNTTYL